MGLASEVQGSAVETGLLRISYETSSINLEFLSCTRKLGLETTKEKLSEYYFPSVL